MLNDRRVINKPDKAKPTDRDKTKVKIIADLAEANGPIITGILGPEPTPLPYIIPKKGRANKRVPYTQAHHK